MGFGIGAHAVPGDYQSPGEAARVGTNGSQIVWMGLWFAAYAADRRPEANRVCAWVDNGYGYGRNGNRSYMGSPFYTGPDGPPRIERNRPATVQPWIDFNFEEETHSGPKTALCVQEYTLRLGLKMKAVTDPDLADLVALFLATCDPEDYQGDLASDLSARLADVMESLLPRLTESCWYETMTETAAVFRFAANHHVGVHYG